MGASLTGKVAIVTGSGQGIGRGIALGLAREGCKVITNNRKPGGAASYRPEDMSEDEYRKILTLRGDAESTVALIRSEGGEAAPFYGDMGDHKTAQRMVEFAMDTYGRLDILVNNAAGLGQGTILTTSESEFDYMTIAKMKGAYNTMHFAAPIMVKQGFGRILNCASGAWTGTPNLCAYSAGNAGVVGLSKAAAMELAPHGITVNVYCPEANSPGHVAEFNKMVRTMEGRLGRALAMSEEKRAEVEADHGPAENLGPMLAYLCTEDAGWINGIVFDVKASGKMSFFSEPVRAREIRKTGNMWTVEELQKSVPKELLFDFPRM